KTEATSGRGNSKLAMRCSFCDREVLINPARAKAYRFCSRSCWAIATNKARALPDLELTCEWCGEKFTKPGNCTSNAKQGKYRFCGRRCSSEYRWADSEFRDKAVAGIKKVFTEEVRRGISERMKANNPMLQPEAREKVSQALAGRTFLA